MEYKEYPGMKTYVVFHTEGTGEQGGSGITEKEIIFDSDDKDECIAFGNNKYPRVSGWEWDNYVININTLTEKGKEQYNAFAKKFDEMKKHADEHPEQYSKYTTTSGVEVFMQKHPLFDDPTFKTKQP